MTEREMERIALRLIRKYFEKKGLGAFDKRTINWVLESNAQEIGEKKQQMKKFFEIISLEVLKKTFE